MYVLFHKANVKGDLLVVLQELFINDAIIKRENSLKVLRVKIDKNLIWVLEFYLKQVIF